MWAGQNEKGEPATIYDMGQNMVGWCKLSVVNTNGASGAGSKVRLRHAEVLKLDQNNYGACGPNPANIFTDNLNLAKQMDCFVLNGDTNQQFQPHFTYHGFRYVEVSAPPSISAQLTSNSIVGCVIHSALPSTGAFCCYDTNFANATVDPLLTNGPVNKLMTNALWGLKGNLQGGVFTACTQREERDAYMYDEHIFSQTACFDLDMSAFLTKWVRDMRDAQAARGDGGYTLISPWSGQPYMGSGGGIRNTDPGGQMAGLLFPWRLYQNYGDTRILAEHYASVTNWLKLLVDTFPNHVWANNYLAQIDDGKSADWYGIHPFHWRPSDTLVGSTTHTNWGTAWYAASADVAADISAVLRQDSTLRGDPARASFYGQQYTGYVNLARSVRSAYTNLSQYIKYDTQGRITNLFLNTQAECVMALAFDMVPETQRTNIVQILLNGEWGITSP
jgi:alpha-L-rhamnosidase